MAGKPNPKSLAQRLSLHKFDSSKYIVLDTGVRRDSTNGRLVVRGPSTTAEKSKK